MSDIQIGDRIVFLSVNQAKKEFEKIPLDITETDIQVQQSIAGRTARVIDIDDQGNGRVYYTDKVFNIHYTHSNSISPKNSFHEIRLRKIPSMIIDENLFKI